MTDLPTDPDPRLLTFDSDIKGQISYWGASDVVRQYLENKKIDFLMSDFSLVKKIQSKAFSWQIGKKLPGSALLQDSMQVDEFLKLEGKKVLKSVYGSSGRGHFFPDRGNNLSKFLQTQFSQNLPVIGEPWMHRVLDFSTQWNFSKTSVEFLGSAQVENSLTGAYIATKIGFDFKEYEWALKEHIDYVKPVLQMLQTDGFLGNVGIDAFVYEENGKKILHPVAEINARKTMSYAALMMQKMHYPGMKMHFSFSKNKTGLLPQKLLISGGEKFFSHNVQVKFEI